MRSDAYHIALSWFRLWSKLPMAVQESKQLRQEIESDLRNALSSFVGLPEDELI